MLDWITPGYQVPVVPSLPPTGTQDQLILVGTTSSGTYYQYDSGGWVNLGPATGFKFGNLPTGTSPIQLQDTKSSNFANLFVINVEDPAPLIVCDQGFVIKKDLAVGGNILSLQGSIIFGRGWTGSKNALNVIIAQSPPLIDLLYSDEQVKSGSSLPLVGSMSNQAGQIFYNTTDHNLYIWNKTAWVLSQINPTGNNTVPTYDTLFLVKNNGYSPAHMDIGNLTAHGNLVVNGDAQINRSGNAILTINSSNSSNAAINCARGGINQATFGVGANNRAYINTASNIPLDLYSNSGIFAQNDFYADTFLPRAGNNTGYMGSGSRYWNGIVVNNLYYKYAAYFGCERSLSGQEWAPGFKDRVSAEKALSDELTRPRYHVHYDADSEDKIVCTCGKKAAMPCPEHLEDWNSRYTVNMNKLTQASSYLTLEQEQRILQLEGEVAELKSKLDKLLQKETGASD